MKTSMHLYLLASVSSIPILAGIVSTSSYPLAFGLSFSAMVTLFIAGLVVELFHERSYVKIPNNISKVDQFLRRAEQRVGELVWFSFFMACSITLIGELFFVIPKHGWTLFVSALCSILCVGLLVAVYGYRTKSRKRNSD